MTIAKRLIILLVVPLVALLGLGLFIRLQLAEVEARNRFVAEMQIPSLAAVGNISRNLADLRVDVRNSVLAATESERANVRSDFERDAAQLAKLLSEYGDHLVSDDRDRRLMNGYQEASRDWLAAARQIISKAADGHRDEATTALISGSFAELGKRLSAVAGEWIAHNEKLANNAAKEAVVSIDTFRWRMLVTNSIAVHQGKLAAVSDSEAGIESGSALAPLSNLKIELESQAGGTPSGEIYAKVVGSSSPGAPQTRVRFTSVSPELKSWMRQVAARACGPSGSAPDPSRRKGGLGI